MKNKVIVVTEGDYKFSEFKVVKSMKNIIWSDYDCIIYHSTIDKLSTVINTLDQEVRKAVPKIVYVNKDLNPLLYCIFRGLEADIYDSDYLEDESVLTYLVEDYHNTGMELRDANKELETISKAVESITSATDVELKELLANSYWTKTLTTSIKQVEDTMTKQSDIPKGVAEQITDVVNQLISLYNTEKEENEQSQQDLLKLKERVKGYELQNNRPNSPFIFNTYEIPLNIENVLYVKLYGPCRFLNSFLLNYQHYLRISKQCSSNILFITPKLKYMMKRYSFATRLAQDTIDVVDLKDSNVFVTHEPTKAVLDRFFSKSSKLFIIIDHMFGDELVRGHMVTQYNALSSATDIARFDLRPERCIIPIIKGPEVIGIPHMQGYLKAAESVRQSMYYDRCKQYYQQMDKEIFKEG